MVRLWGSAVVALAMLVGGAWSAAAPPDPAAANAALHYWRAFSVIPNLNEIQENSLRNALDKLGPLDGQAAQAIELAAAALKELHRGAGCRGCVWATPLDDGAGTLLPHCAKALQLARLACARAHLRFQRGQSAAAIDDLLAAMTLGRHVASEAIVVSLVVDYAIEREAIGVAARHLGGLEPAELKDFAARLDRLPAAPTMRRVMQVEKEFLLEPFIRDLSQPGGKERAAEIAEIIAGGEDPNAKALADLSLEQLHDAAIALRPVYDKLAAMMDRPPAQFRAPESLLAEMKLSGAARTLGMVLLSYAVAFRTNEAAHHTRLLMFKAAIAVVHSGPRVLDAECFKEPYAGGPFSLHKTGGGFRLVSKTLERDGKPVTLEVPQKVPKPPFP